MNFKKQRPDSPFFFEKKQVIPLLRLKSNPFQRISLFFVSLSILVLLSACGATASPSVSGASSSAVSSTAAAKEFTVDELAKFDGQNGNPAYIAVDGNVYDVSNATPWANGSHFGKFTAGKDLSKAIVLVSHGKSRLSEVPLIGTLK